MVSYFTQQKKNLRFEGLDDIKKILFQIFSDFHKAKTRTSFNFTLNKFKEVYLDWSNIHN